MSTIVRFACEIAVLGVLASAAFVALCVVYACAVTVFVRWQDERFEREITKRWGRKS